MLTKPITTIQIGPIRSPNMTMKSELELKVLNVEKPIMLSFKQMAMKISHVISGITARRHTTKIKRPTLRKVGRIFYQSDVKKTIYFNFSTMIKLKR